MLRNDERRGRAPRRDDAARAQDRPFRKPRPFERLPIEVCVN
jgi:hypothetical protein